MKKVIIGLLVACTFGLVACFEDDSKFSSVDVGAIEISGLKDTTMVSFIGNVLNIVPEIKTDYPESSLTYAWYLFESEDSDLENGYQENKIAETKELSYEINLTSGITTVP